MKAVKQKKEDEIVEQVESDEESDEYDIVDEEDGEESGEEDSEEDEEDEDEEGPGLTALLLGSASTAPVTNGDNEEDDDGWTPDGRRDPAEFSGEEPDADEDDEEGHSPKNQTAVSPSLSPTKKRAREEEAGDTKTKKARPE